MTLGQAAAPDRAPGGGLPAQQQADAAAQRPHRAVLPQVLEEEGEREAVSPVDAPRSMFGDDDDVAVSLVFALGSGESYSSRLSLQVVLAYRFAFIGLLYRSCSEFG